MRGFWLVTLVVPVVFSAAQAQLFKCHKDGGGFTYTSNPAENQSCVAEKSYEEKPKTALPKTVAPQKPPTKKKLPPITNQSLQSPAGAYPDVSPSTQNRRDRKRSEVLLYELADEQRRFDIVREKLINADGSQPASTAFLKEQAKIHYLNITALAQELARLGIYVNHSGN